MYQQEAYEFITYKDLLEAINSLDKERYELVILLSDKASALSPHFLEKIYNAYDAGIQAMQLHTIINNRKGVRKRFHALSEEINNSLFRSGNTQIGFSSSLFGTNMAFDLEWLQKNQRTAKTNLERKLLKQNIYIEYLEDVYTYDEKVRGKKEFYNQRRRWLATQFSNLFSGISQLPGAMLSGKWDYCDKLFQWMMPPRVLLLGFVILIACFLTVINIFLSIKWLGLLLFIGITFSLAVPDYLVDRQFKRAIISLPILFFLMFLNLFRLRGGSKKFIHTKHSAKHENSH